MHSVYPFLVVTEVLVVLLFEAFAGPLPFTVLLMSPFLVCFPAWVAVERHLFS